MDDYIVTATSRFQLTTYSNDNDVRQKWLRRDKVKQTLLAAVDYHACTGRFCGAVAHRLDDALRSWSPFVWLKTMRLVRDNMAELARQVEASTTLDKDVISGGQFARNMK